MTKSGLKLGHVDLNLSIFAEFNTYNKKLTLTQNHESVSNESFIEIEVVSVQEEPLIDVMKRRLTQ